jgi:hypothetical protein
MQRCVKDAKLIYEEAKFLAGVFFDIELPREKLFVFRYFRSPLERQFVRYYYCFGEIDNFVDHTGFACQKRWLLILKKRFDKLVEKHGEYRKEAMLDQLKEIEKGKIKHLKLNNFNA